MNIEISYIHRKENEWSVTRAIAAIIHAGLEEKINFKVRLNPDAKGGYGHNGTGTLTVPEYKVGRDFITQVIENPIKTKWSRKLFFKKVPQPPPKHLIQTLARTTFVDPDQEERHAKIMLETGDTVRLEKVQFGTLQYHPPYPGRSFSIEWGRSYAPVGFAELSFEYNNKLIRITIREDFETHRDPEEYMIVLKFSNIKKIGVGLTFGESFVLFDTYTPPILEKKHVYRTLKGDHTDNKKYKQRVGSLDPAHHAVAPYATKLRLILWREPSQVAEEERARFFRLCNSAKLKSLVKIFRDTTEIPAEPMGFFKASRLEKLQHALAQLAFPVAFQIEALMRNGLLHTEHIEHLLPRIQELSNNSTPPVVSELLRTYRKDLEKAGDKLGAEEHPVEQTFKKTLSAFEAKDDEAFRCGHVTFTPTRMVLEGPYPTDSNRIIRKYKEHRDHFLRVDFRDEELMQYRWEREVDGASFLKERVGGILKDGFQLAGRSFEFLAYSNSALKSHAVWFINPFQFTLSPNQKIWVNGEYIRQNIGNFAGSDLLRHPSKYAARLAQAFTATDSSVRLHRNNWEEVPDLGTKPYLFTDGVGTISEEKRDEIWDAMKKKRGGLVPSAFMIRFLGYKGVVVVDRELDVLNSARTAGEHPIHMRLRPSMRKFAAVSDGEADIEIADAYNTPKPCNLNRALVMLLERLGVEKDAFIKLQDNEVAKAKTIDENLVKFKAVIDQHGLGKPYRLTSILEQLRELGFEINSNSGLPSADTPFLRLLRSVAVIKVLRDIMFSARIPIPGSYLLVGVADEGVVYEKAGYENVYTLPEFNIYACIQREGEEKEWIEGFCFITRSPVAHPGDVQRVYAIGEPPADCFCAFRDLVNVVVMPSAGDRSLASCLGGGDLDGDEFAVITDPSLLPNEHFDAANYEPPKFEPWERDCEVEDICDFFVEYINSDVLGLLSDRLLVIADQSKEGLSDPACLRLAALCSQAVDYPKQGIPVDLDAKGGLPRTLIRCNPDWKASEVTQTDDENTDNYRSDKALGHLYRKVKDELLQIPEEDLKPSSSRYSPLTDPISKRLIPLLDKHFEPGFASNPAHQRPLKEFEEIQKTFDYYSRELEYICFTHTLSNKPGDRLMEAEVVMSTILANHSQKRLRKERVERMETHTEALVHDVEKRLFPGGNRDAIGEEQYMVGLGRGWIAWYLSQVHAEQEGANSFGLMALGIVLDCVAGLGPTSAI